MLKKTSLLILAALAFFSAFINDTKEANKARIKEIVRQKRRQIIRNPALWNNEPSRKSLEALIQVMEKYK